jgi:hypothetical protein
MDEEFEAYTHPLLLNYDLSTEMAYSLFILSSLVLAVCKKSHDRFILSILEQRALSHTHTLGDLIAHSSHRAVFRVIIVVCFFCSFWNNYEIVISLRFDESEFREHGQKSCVCLLQQFGSFFSFSKLTWAKHSSLSPLTLFSMMEWSFIKIAIF